MKISLTASLFHAVDQMSSWSTFSHASYREWAKSLTWAETMALGEHAKMRKARGWGQGFEQSFYVETDLRRATKDAIAADLLTREEAEAELRIFLLFMPRLQPLFNEQNAHVERFERLLRAKGPALGPILQQLAHVFEVRDLAPIEMFLVPGPERSGGGGFNGGRLVVEVGAKYEPLPTFLHEASHVIAATRKPAIDEAARTCGDDLDGETLGEGLAYAIAPGMAHPMEKGDPLARTVASFDKKGTPNTDAYARFNRLALELRPILREALDRGAKLDDLLLRSCEAWRRVHARW